MTRRTRRALGWAILSLPFIGVFGLAWTLVGWWAAVAIFAACLVLVVLINAGSHLIDS